MEMTQSDMMQLVDDLYAATGVGDFDRAETMLTDDFFVNEAVGLPMAGVYRGRGALRELYTKVMGLMDVASLDREMTLTGANCAVVILSFKFADPTLERARIAELFRFREGKVCEIMPYYFDPAPVHAACATRADDCTPK